MSAKKSSVVPPEIDCIESQTVVEPEPPETRWQRHKHLALAVVAGLIVGGLMLSAFFVWLRAKSPTLNSPGEVAQEATPTPIPEEPSFTAVLVGYGGAGHDGSSLTDSILIARVLLEQKRVILLSVPRDLWVSVSTESDGEKSMKINAVYVLHGPEVFKQTLGDVTGWKIDRYFGLDFRGFTQAIDSLGGVELTVDRAFNDYEYPITGRERMVCEEEKDETGAVTATPDPVPEDGILSVADEIAAGLLDRETLPENVKNYPCRYEHLKFEAGPQTLTGTQALKYARSRHSAEDGNDFNRARRQQNLIVALGTQVIRTNSITKIPSLFSTLRGNTATDFSALEIAEWLAKAAELRQYPISSLLLSDKNYLKQGYSSDRQFVLQPLAGQFEWSAIRGWLKGVTGRDQFLAYPVIEIQTPPSQRVFVEEQSAFLASSSAWPVRVNSVGAARSSTASAVIYPLVPNLQTSDLELLAERFVGSIDSSRISSSSSVLNGPHIRIEWR